MNGLTWHQQSRSPGKPSNMEQGLLAKQIYSNEPKTVTVIVYTGELLLQLLLFASHACVLFFQYCILNVLLYTPNSTYTSFLFPAL